MSRHPSKLNAFQFAGPRSLQSEVPNLGMTVACAVALLLATAVAAYADEPQDTCVACHSVLPEPLNLPVEGTPLCKVNGCMSRYQSLYSNQNIQTITLR